MVANVESALLSMPPGTPEPRADRTSGQALRQAFGRFATGVAVVTGAAPDGSPIGLTINSFVSVSLDPPLILWALRKASAAVDVFGPGSCFAVHVLGEGHEAMARRFAGRDRSSFAGLPWMPDPRGVPLIDGVLARFDCRTQAVLDAGDHRLIIAGVEGFRAASGKPLVFALGDFRHLNGT